MTGNSNKTFILGAIITVLIFTGGIFLLAKGEKSISKEEQLQILGAYDEKHVKGNLDSSVELIVFSDFQCPACAQAYSFLAQIGSEYKDNLKIVYRHFPLRNIHPNAQLAAEASEAAASVGKFWEMHDILFENQAEWEDLSSADFRSKLIDYAQVIEIEDIEKFSSDITNGTYENKVNDEYNSALKLGLEGTPTIFVNGQQVENWSYSGIKSAIDKVLNES